MISSNIELVWKRKVQCTFFKNCTINQFNAILEEFFFYYEIKLGCGGELGTNSIAIKFGVNTIFELVVDG